MAIRMRSVSLVRQPERRFIGIGSERLQELFFLMDISIVAVLFPLFKSIIMEFFPLFSNGFFYIGQAEEGFVPQCRQDSCRCIRNTAFDMALVLRMADACRDDCGP